MGIFLIRFYADREYINYPDIPGYLYNFDSPEEETIV
jgi:hypothetical protein